MSSLLEYLPFYSYFFGPEKVLEQQLQEVDFWSWLCSFFVTPTPPPVLPVEQDGYLSAILCLKETYDATLDEVIRLHAPDSLQQSITGLHVSLCLTPFLVALAFFSLVSMTKFGCRNGKKLLLGIAYIIQRLLQDNEKNELELRMDFLESLITRNAKAFQEDKSETDNKMVQWIDDHSADLRSTQNRLNDLIQQINDLLQPPPVKNQYDVINGKIDPGQNKSGDGVAANVPKPVDQI
ncbi:uncharacterized protein LOC143459539 [Clavelina lepadiformis]|uniref:uncharacterized protein LOC143459539 n=1 Tax=Clavelina lepadiformis TaxID=159417 RepID=UPI0040438649